jgi:hypothetical protein
MDIDKTKAEKFKVETRKDGIATCPDADITLHTGVTPWRHSQVVGEAEDKEKLGAKQKKLGGTHRNAWEALCFNRGTARNECSACLSTCYALPHAPVRIRRSTTQ